MSWWRRPRPWAGILTAGVIGVALIPEFDLEASIDRDLAILTLTLVGLIWSACFTFEAVHEPIARAIEDRETRRRMRATALLSELKTIEGQLRELAEREAGVDSFSVTVLERSLVEPEIFSPETVHRLITFANRLHWTRTALPQAIAARGGQGSRPDMYRRNARAAANLSVQAAVELARALTDIEGGTAPAAADDPVIHPGDELPPLPPSTFGVFERDRGWRRL